MRNRQENDFRNNQTDTNARWLHRHHHGENSDRGNYTVDSHFNSGRGEYDVDYMDSASFNSNDDQGYHYPQGRFQAGGAQYMGEDFAGRGQSTDDNIYGMTYTPQNRYNSGRHYDARADYSNRDYSDYREQHTPRSRYGLADERFGHEVSRGNRDDYSGHSSMGDIESYRRYEQFDPRYDNDYSGGFAGRNYTDGADHFGEGRYYSNLDRWRGEQNQQQNYGRGRGRRSDRDR
ncbi:hypothetical protein H7F15_03265 [Pontibacter sp. Tf4]|uniref:hypothetical protein n=1 Tax=Pontibacter sp. Tf4 TaxID=2761620 RepID=UPI00162A99AD|nr:hypothetical protein [Pontibacter sp. Tf4]MBB6610046.1 hypothetical protein [Pontibacter sp. Tf4]